MTNHGLEHNPGRMHECCNPDCQDIITDGLVYRLNRDEVICLPCWVEAAVIAWASGIYSHLDTP
jgi:hypothetical protein